MTNPLDDHRSNEEEASPSMSRSAEDNLSNSDGPLLLNTAAGKKRDDVAAALRSQMQSSAMLLHQDNWHKSCAGDDEYSVSEKMSHRCMWMLTIVLTFIGFCNLLLNMTILIVLRVSHGMEALEVIPEKNLLKFSGNTDLDRVCLQRGICESFGDEPIELMGNAGGVNIQVANRHHSLTWSSLQILKNGTSISQVDSFQVKDPRSASPIFSTDFPNFNLPKGVQKVELGLTQTHRIAAPKMSDLVIESDDKITLHGAEGTTLDSKEILWTAKNNIFLSSKNGEIVIDVKDGVNLPKIPIASNKLSNQSELQQQYKICVCMPDGKLFLVPASKGNLGVNCAKASRIMESDPCAM
ncbi:beta-sarcoglycan [Nasonia vitripennis]|uniref:Beta-sarcoglycan n=1 Tax=Nasonia vitripennis TaxID=7425 RepID=A0A7M7LMR2_NASVI|nr:beta-sarcoglycan [Nasonia vitripennis]